MFLGLENCATDFESCRAQDSVIVSIFLTLVFHLFLLSSFILFSLFPGTWQPAGICLHWLTSLSFFPLAFFSLSRSFLGPLTKHGKEKDRNRIVFNLGPEVYARTSSNSAILSNSAMVAFRANQTHPSSLLDQ